MKIKENVMQCNVAKFSTFTTKVYICMYVRYVPIGIYYVKT